MKINNLTILFFVITVSIFLYGCTTKIPEPDTTKESQSLLVIPFSVEYPSNFNNGRPVKGWGIKFSSKTGIFDKDKTILFDPKMGQDFHSCRNGTWKLLSFKNYASWFRCTS